MNNKISANFLVLLFGISTTLSVQQLKSMEQVSKNLSKVIYAKDLVSNYNDKYIDDPEDLGAIKGLSVAQLMMAIGCIVGCIECITTTDHIPIIIFLGSYIVCTLIKLHYSYKVSLKRKFDALSALDEIVENLANEKPNLENKNYDKECLICLSDATENPLYINCRCSHYYHEHCLKTWLNQARMDNNEDIFKCIKCKKILNKLVLSNPD